MTPSGPGPSSRVDPALDPARRRAFVLANTVLRPAPHVPEVRLHLADDMTLLWQRMEAEAGRTGLEPPFWASAWAGGQAVARHLLATPSVVAGRRVLDVASGSGLCAIAAALAGAGRVDAADIDPFSQTAVEVNAAANGVLVTSAVRDVLATDLAGADVVLAGDVCYERRMAERFLSWLRDCRDRGVDVLLGDPGRAFLPEGALVEVGRYAITGDPMLENVGVTSARVFTLA